METLKLNLQELLNDNLDGTFYTSVSAVKTLLEAEVTTQQNGLVLYFADGTEFHLVIVKHL